MIESFAAVPTGLLIFFAAVFGLIIGSFLNVFIYRFHTGRSLSGSSHCLSCGTSLRAQELVPLLSYLALKGRCRTCTSYIPTRYFLVELATSLLFVLVALSIKTIPLAIIAFVLVSVLLVVAVYDLYHMVIPNEFVVVLLGLAFLQWWYLLGTGHSLNEFAYSLLAAVGAGAFFFALWYYSKGTWIGFGDVKLVVPLGLLVGYTGVFSVVVLSFWTGALVGLVLVAIEKIRNTTKVHLRFLDKKITMKSAVPFAPFLIIGFILVYFFGVDVIDLLTYA